MFSFRITIILCLKMIVDCITVMKAWDLEITTSCVTRPSVWIFVLRFHIKILKNVQLICKNSTKANKKQNKYKSIINRQIDRQIYLML